MARDGGCMIIEALIEEGRALYNRVRVQLEHGAGNVPSSQQVLVSELDAWYSGVGLAIAQHFGPGSPATLAWASGLERIRNFAHENVGRIRPTDGSWVLHNLTESIGVLYSVRLLAVSAPKTPSDDVSELDPKVGLLRPERFQADLNDALARTLEAKEPLTLVFLDIDRFKSVNDNHGHLIGDEVLAGVAGLLKEVVGARGVCYRYGGEEFTVLLPNFTAEEGAAVAERARLQVERNPVAKAQLSVTASFGVAEAPAHATSAEDLLKRADDALYDAKHRGRNLVRISGEPPSGSAVAKPRRRQPDPAVISDEESEKIRHQYFRSGEANCPKDGAVLRIAEVAAHKRKAADLSIFCPFCGLRSMLRGPR